MSDGIKVLDVSELTDYGKQILETATKEMPKIAKSFLKGEANHLKNKAKKKVEQSIVKKLILRTMPILGMVMWQF